MSASKRTIKGETSVKYLKENPDMACRALARLMVEETGLWPSVEHARKSLLYYRGQSGGKNLQRLATEECVDKNGDYRRSPDGIPSKAGARILIFDIETAPSLAYVWGMFKVFVQPSQLVQSGRILSYAAKWLGEDEMYFDSIKDDIPHSRALGAVKKSLAKILDFPAFDALWKILVFYSTSDRRICETLYGLFEEADIVVAHNGQAFDVHTMNAHWIKHGIEPPPPYKIVDTLKIAKREFKFPRNKLESIARFLDVGKKTEHEGFDLWVKCMAREKEAWETMEEYNIQDVNLLEEVYMLLRPWDTRHPNVSLCYDDAITRCTVCGSSAIIELNKQARTSASNFPSYRCEGCGHVMRSRKREKPILGTDEQMSNVI